jgi:drug/metabolite transporter (DMT)-like permease
VSGEVGALLAAVCWAVSSTIFTAQARRIGPLSVNAVRSFFAALFVLLLVPFFGSIGELREMSVSTLVALVGSGILAMGLGDSLFFASLPLMGASRAIPISNGLYPLLALLLATIWLGEEATWLVLLGTALIIVGVTLLVGERTPAVGEGATGAGVVGAAMAGGQWRKGLLLLAVACVVWAFSTTWLKAGGGDADVLAAGTIRIVINGLILLPLAYRWEGKKDLLSNGVRDTVALAAAGVIGIGIGSLLYIFAVQEAGAGKTAVLTSTLPLFALPLAVLFLHERITAKVVGGTALCILGIWFVAA